MKELEQPQKLDALKMVNQREVQKHKEKIGMLRFRAGQVCWEYNVLTNAIKRAQVVDVAVMTQDERKRDVVVTQHRVEVRDGCLYVVAINYRNAVRKFIKLVDKMF